MNLDELKSAWNADNTDNVRIPSRIKKLGAAKLPLDKLKRNMKNEFYMQSTCILLAAFAPQLLKINPSLYAFYYAFYVISIVISVYYMNLFRLFYNKINHYTAGTKDNLLEIYYEFKLNIERYHAFTFLLLPIAFAAHGFYSYSMLLQRGEDISANSHEAIISFITISLFVSIFVILTTLAWTKYLYGPYLGQLKIILDELKEEDLRDENLKMNAMQTNDTKEIQPKKGE
ncbi:hypothetical protein ACFX5U_15770 [Sphingobacterium sp. SG20118]|uniref:hypothetical protein n=1 Tax=Sphingobacterium sp. SG20118 TaxID=3367156 RepID=UPI0037DFC3C2